jgi:hypothetical protein
MKARASVKQRNAAGISSPLVAGNSARLAAGSRRRAHRCGTPWISLRLRRLM